MITHANQPEVENQRIDEAGHWYMLLQSGEMAPDEIQRWQAWSRDAANRKALDDIGRVSQWATGLKGSLSAGEGGAAAPIASSPARMKWLAAAALLLSLTGAIAYWRWSPPQSAAPGIYETTVAEHRTIQLSDGSSISLGGKTAVAVEFASDRRRVVLRQGEALFTVARDSKRPFTVMAGQGAITALGTTFDVHRAADRVVVKVMEGRVRVTRPDTGQAQVIAMLRSGEQVAYGAERAPARIERIEPQETGMWRDGRLQYRNEALKYVAADVNRYSGRHVVLADGQAESLLYTGTVYQDRIDEWLQGLTDLYPVELVQTDGTQILVRSRAQPP